jgi:hypothetical protein
MDRQRFAKLEHKHAVACTKVLSGRIHVLRWAFGTPHSIRVRFLRCAIRLLHLELIAGEAKEYAVCKSSMLRCVL